MKTSYRTTVLPVLFVDTQPNEHRQKMANPATTEAIPAGGHTTNAHPNAAPVTAAQSVAQPVTTQPVASESANPPTHPATNVRRKLRTFTYIPSYDEILVKAVRDVDAHKADHGQKEKVFEKVRENFLLAVPARVFETYERPSVKSVRDRFIRLEEKRREAVRRNELTSGNVEMLTDIDVLLEDLILEKDEWMEEERAEKDKSNEREKALVAAGEAIRNQALSRKRRMDDDGEEGEKQPTERTPKKRGTASTSALEDVSACMIDTAERQRVMDEKRVAIEEQRLAFEGDRAVKQDERFERTQSVAERRQILDERRFELEKAEREERMREDREERKEGREERKAMLSLIQKLMEK